jgi:hypothetical protein
MFEHPDLVGGILIWLVIFYLMVFVGYRMAKGYSGYAFWVYGSFALGILTLLSKNAAGYFLLIPMTSFLVVKLAGDIDIDYETRQKVKGSVFSGIGSAATYAITHMALGFGVMEASLSSLIAAAILGYFGLTS